MDKLFEKENVWKPQQALGRKIHNRKAGQSVTQLMCKLQNQQNASELDIDTFDGDPLEFHYFMAIFHWKNGRWCMGKAYTFDKIHQGWSQGDGKNLHEVTTWGWVQDCKEIAAWKIWRSRKITAAYKNQIKKWPDAYRKIQNVLIKCENIDQIQDWNVLNTPDLFVCWFQSCQGVGEIGGLEKSWQ